MQAPARSRALKRSRRISFLKKDKEGVASTVGTIMALLVFIAFMAMITNSYVPAWMNDNERNHMNTVMDQFGELKGKIDSMIVQMEVTGTVPTKMYAPIALGSAGVPLFAVPTGGILYYNPMGTNVTGTQVEFQYSGGHYVSDIGGGKAELYCPNRYYVQQTVAYENGAILVKQGDNSTMRGFPGLDIYYTIGDTTNEKIVHIAYTEIDMIGSNASMSGSDATGLNIKMVFIDSQSYVIQNSDVRLSFITMYEQAWMTYLKDLLNTTGMVSGTDFTLTTQKLSSGATQINLIVKGSDIIMDYSKATVSMSMLS